MIKKVLGGVIGILVLAVIIFYFVASSSWENEANYHQLVNYTDQRQYTSDTLTAMTYNIGYLSGMTNNLSMPSPKTLYDQNLSLAKQLMGSLDPDIVGFQEIDYQSKRSYDVQQLDELRKSGPYTHAYQSVNWDTRYVPFPYWPPKYHFGKTLSGQAILAKGELNNENVITLPKPINAPFYYNAFYPERLIQIVDWQVNGATIKVLNLHLEAFDQETRVIHAREVKQLYESFAQEMPVILMGDFNSPPAVAEGEDGMDILMTANSIASAISDAAYVENPSAFHTFSSRDPTKMIDFILYNPSHISPIEAFVPDAGEISDHLPVVFTFKLADRAH